MYQCKASVVAETAGFQTKQQLNFIGFDKFSA
jgi:hypothetical protein